ncbi:MAG: hypothetical protein RIM72_16940 [Alphaproteobacteria bacterium]
MNRYVTISDPAEIEDILKSDQNQVAEAVNNFSALSSRMAMPLLFSEKLVALTPLANNGERHKELRQSARADLVRPASGDLESRYETILLQAVKKCEISGPIDLLAEVIDPLSDETLFQGNTITQALPDSVKFKLSRAVKNGGGFTRFFDPGCPIAIRKRNESILQELDCILMENGVEEHARDGILRSLVVMGRDPMRGYLSAHLVASWKSSQGKNKDRTGCPFLGGVQWVMRIKPPQTDNQHSTVQYRLMLSVSQSLAFGSGPHQCLGKANALQAAKILEKTFERCRLRVDITRFDAAEPTSVFSTPKALEGQIVDDCRAGQES